MRHKIMFFTGIGLGYVLGSRAGRESYEKLKAKAQKAWEDPRVQRVVSETQGFVREKAPIVQERVGEAASATVSGTKVAAAKVAEGTKTAVSGAQDAAAKAAETARTLAEKLSEAAKDLSGKAASTAKNLSNGVSRSAEGVTGRVTETAATVRNRIADRGEEAIDGVIIAAAEARDRALETELDDEDELIDDEPVVKPPRDNPVGDDDLRDELLGSGTPGDDVDDTRDGNKPAQPLG